MLDFIWEYLVGPIVAEAVGEPAVWRGVEAVAGYNMYNTLLWAFLALSLVLGIKKLFEIKDVELTPEHSVLVLPLIILGGLLRFIQDAQDLNFYIEILLITPIIYIWIGVLATVFIYLNSFKDVTKYLYLIVAVLAAFSLTLLPSISLTPIILIFAATAIIGVLYFYITQGTKYNTIALSLAVASQFFEAFSSMYALTQGFETRQLLTSLFVGFFGPPGFLVLKIGILAAALSLYFDLEEEWKAILLIALYSIGFATGLRVLLRAATGI